MADREVSNAELAEDIAQLRAEDLAQLRQDLRDFRAWATDSLVDKEVYQAHREARVAADVVVDHRLSSIEGRMTWVARTAVTAFFFPILVPVLVGLILVLVGLGQGP